VLSPGGRTIASIRLAEGNVFGSSGSPDGRDSMHDEWQYPGVSWFTLGTVKRTAKAHGLDVAVKPEYTRLLTSRRPHEVHDWLVLSR
jgi:hypothetical protein